MERLRVCWLAFLLTAGTGCLEQNPDWDTFGAGSASSDAGPETGTQSGTADASSEGADASTASGGDGDGDTVGDGETTGGDGDGDTTGGGEVAVLVVEDTAVMEAIDVDVYDLLVGMGFTVEVVASLDPEWNGSAALILINETASSANVATKYRNNPNPVLCMVAESWFAMRMSTGAPSVPMLTDVDIVDDTHPMAAGYTGTQPLMDDLGILVVDEAELGASAQIVARGAGVGGVTIFAYESGDPMTGGLSAPARRAGVGFDVDAGAATSFADPEGVNLVRAAVEWTAGIP